MDKSLQIDDIARKIYLASLPKDQRPLARWELVDERHKLSIWYPRAELQIKATAAECYETPVWAAEGILELEDIGPRVVDPCCGPGVLTRAAQARGLTVTATDLYDWGFGLVGVDFLAMAYAPVYQAGGDFTVFMNPPFSKACEFVEHAFALGARKVVCFQRFAWYESVVRREFWDDMPLSRIWLCGNRASCWRVDISEEERKKSGGSTTAHAWFIFEPGHVGNPIVKRFYKGKTK